jgi:hypothetical protein
VKDFRSINVKVPSDLHDEFVRVIPRGLRLVLMKSILTLVLDAIRSDGEIVLGAIMAGEYKLSLSLRHREVVHKMNEGDDGQT